LEYVGLWGVGGLNQGTYNFASQVFVSGIELINVSLGDLADEERAKMEDAFVVGTAGTIAPKAWSGFFSGREASRRRTKFGEEEVGDVYIFCRVTPNSSHRLSGERKGCLSRYSGV